MNLMTQDLSLEQWLACSSLCGGCDQRMTCETGQLVDRQDLFCRSASWRLMSALFLGILVHNFMIHDVNAVHMLIVYTALELSWYCGIILYS